MEAAGKAVFLDGFDIVLEIRLSGVAEQVYMGNPGKHKERTIRLNNPV